MSSTSEISSASDAVQVTLSTAINPKMRGLIIVGSGTISGTLHSGTVVADFPAYEGYNKVRFTEITAQSAGVTDIWAYF